MLQSSNHQLNFDIADISHSLSSGDTIVEIGTDAYITGGSDYNYVNGLSLAYNTTAVSETLTIFIGNDVILNNSDNHELYFNALRGGDYYRFRSQSITGTDLLTCGSSAVKVVADPASGSKTVGSPFNVDVKVEDGGAAFNAARATVAISSNLSITGIHNPTSNACNLQYTTHPTTSNPSFAGAIFGSLSTDCTVYTMTLTPTATGTGTVTFTNGSIKSYADNSEILTGVENASFILTDGPTPTPTPNLDFTVTNPLLTYHSSFNLTGTKLTTITHIFVNGSNDDATYPTSITWEAPVTLSLGNNNFTLYGTDDSSNQTATQTIAVGRHTLGDINGDGNIDLTDFSILAKLEE